MVVDLDIATSVFQYVAALDELPQPPPIDVIVIVCLEEVQVVVVDQELG